MPGRTVFTLLEDAAQRYGSTAALHQPLGAKSGGGYNSFSWNDWLEQSRAIAVGLTITGFATGEIACILCETRAEFYIVDLAIMGAGGVAGALYTAYPMSELAKSVASIRPRFLFVEDAKQWSLLAAELQVINAEIPAHVILISGDRAENALTLQDLIDAGRRALSNDSSCFEKLKDRYGPESPAILYLTSGATGEPKMSLTSHAAVLANADHGPVVLPMGPGDGTIAFLPSAHIAQRIVLEIVPLRMGAPVWFSESLSRLPNELRTIRPTVFLAPPRLWERMYATIHTEIRKLPESRQRIFRWALEKGKRAAQTREQGKRLGIFDRAALSIADRLVFRKIRERLGGRIRVAASGAAPLGRELGEFYAAIGMPLIEGYGLTEAGVVSLNPLDQPKMGSVGKPLPGVEMRLGEDNELQIRTPCMFLGYYKDEAATSSVMTDDGWFLTGDIASVDADGYWFITGRKKELIVSSNGKKIYPARIESLFKVEPLINQVLLIGDKKPYVTALITLNTAQGADADRPALDKKVQEAVARVNRQLADFERIRRFRILEEDFSIERGELTPTMKLRRSRVLETRAPLVAELYLGKEEMP